MKALNLVIVLCTASLVFCIAAYILDISMRSSYSNARLASRFELEKRSIEVLSTVCAALVPGCSSASTYAHFPWDTSSTITF